MMCTELRKLCADLLAADVQDHERFRALVRQASELLMLTDDELSCMFDISRPIATRWRNGTNVPHPALRKNVYSKLSSRAAWEIEKQQTKNRDT